MNSHDGQDNTIFLIIVFAVFIVLGIPALYLIYSNSINGFLLVISKVQLKPFIFFSEEAYTAWQYIIQLNPENLTWGKMFDILSYTGKWMRWPLSFILICFGIIAIYLGKTASLTRRLNMDTLLEHNDERFSCLKPVVGKGEYLLAQESYDTGNWRIAQSPLQFAAEHQLLLDEAGKPFELNQILTNGLGYTELPAFGNAFFAEKKAHKILEAQLGGKYSGFGSLTSVRKALLAAFLAYAGGEKDVCISILNEVSENYQEDENKAPLSTVLEQNSFQKRCVGIFNKHKIILKEPCILKHITFELPFFMSVLTRARKKGVLASSQFIWLRPLDRTLWYTLNQCGGRTAWAESLAPWSHYMREEKMSKTLKNPQFTMAIKSLHYSLDAQGWLKENLHNKDDKNYDAENDDALIDEIY